MQNLNGLVPGMTNAAYHAAPGISSSKIKDLVGSSLLHFWHKHVRPDREPREETDALRFGTAVHGAVLEPDLFGREYVAAPEDAPSRPTKRSLNAKRQSPQTVEAIDFWEDFDAANAGKIILSADEHARALAIRDRVHGHPVAAGLLRGGRAEQSFFATDAETGALIKCRPDYLHDNGFAIVDLKTTRDASPAGFAKEIANLLYDVSAPWYLDVLRALYGEAPRHFIWLAVESEAPHAIGIYYAKPEDVVRARACGRQQLLRLVDAMATDNWPDFGTEVLPADMPGWVRR